MQVEDRPDSPSKGVKSIDEKEHPTDDEKAIPEIEEKKSSPAKAELATTSEEKDSPAMLSLYKFFLLSWIFKNYNVKKYAIGKSY